MKRTQLYLSEDMAHILAVESRRRGTTVSELVREAVASTYGRSEASNRGDLIRRLAGVWQDRDDLGSTDALVRNLRRSKRSERWDRGERGKVSTRQRRHN